jgi:hypothetical protein
MKEKIYRRTFYRVETKKLCGCVSVDQDGYVYEYGPAPCFQWMTKKRWKFHEILKFLTSKYDLISSKIIDKEIDPF